MQKSKGKARFGIDTFIPDMLYASVARPPIFGPKEKSSIRAPPGKSKEWNRWLRIGRGVAVYAGVSKRPVGDG